MPSHAHAEPLDTFQRDVPTSSVDIETLWRMRDRNAMTPQEYLEFLLLFTKNLPAERSITPGEPFEL
jgi:hypothetical protein